MCDVTVDSVYTEDLQRQAFWVLLGAKQNKKNKIKRIPVMNVALKLFDACILPVLTYGVEIWTVFERFDFDPWDHCPVEQVYLSFYKHLLSLNRFSINLTYRADHELRRRPFKLVTDLRVLNYGKHCENLPPVD